MIFEASASAAHLALVAVAYLLAKHAIADYFLQTTYLTTNKGKYGHPAGLIHAGEHIALTAPVFLIIPPSSGFAAIIILALEFVVHYHTDWLKENIVKSRGWDYQDAQYWHAIGADQFVHGMTYIAIVWYLIS